jgi:hypothetical protein
MLKVRICITVSTSCSKNLRFVVLQPAEVIGKTPSTLGIEGDPFACSLIGNGRFDMEGRSWLGTMAAFCR